MSSLFDSLFEKYGAVVTVPELAEILKVSPQIIYKDRCENRLSLKPVGNDRKSRLRFSVADVAAYLTATSEEKTEQRKRCGRPRKAVTSVNVGW